MKTHFIFNQSENRSPTVRDLNPPNTLAREIRARMGCKAIFISLFVFGVLHAGDSTSSSSRNLRYPRLFGEFRTGHGIFYYKEHYGGEEKSYQSVNSIALNWAINYLEPGDGGRNNLIYASFGVDSYMPIRKMENYANPWFSVGMNFEQWFEFFMGHTFTENFNFSFGYSVRVWRFQLYDLYLGIKGNTFNKGDVNAETEYGQGTLGLTLKYSGLRHPTKDGKIEKRYDIGNRVIKRYEKGGETVNLVARKHPDEPGGRGATIKRRVVIDSVKADTLYAGGEAYHSSEVKSVVSSKYVEDTKKEMTGLIVGGIISTIMMAVFLFYISSQQP